METKNVIYTLRKKKGLSQDALAEKVLVTRQAVSRWETGETVPNTETLKLLSKEFNVSINTLLGSPEKRICQCCGMPLEDDILSMNEDGSLNEDYCRWCVADGVFTYSSMEDVIDVCVKNRPEGVGEEEARKYLQELLPKLDYWKRYEELGDHGEYDQYKKQLMKEINDLQIPGMPEVKQLYALAGSYINLAYRLPNGDRVQFLDNEKTYLGTQLECEFDETSCFGVAAGMDFILISTYGKDGENPELIVYRRR